jgi:predicted nucleotidyltransferase
MAMLRLMKFTKEGLIVSALMDGAKCYTELKAATGLSNAWLSKKLKELLRHGLVCLRDGLYYLNIEKLRSAIGYEKPFTAMQIAIELSQKPEVVAVILFGSLIHQPDRKEADVDLLIVTECTSIDPVAVSLQMFRRFGIAVDIVEVHFTELMRWLDEKPPLLFSVLSGYDILFDRGWFRGFFKLVEKIISRDWIYCEREKLWVRKELLSSILKQRKST